MDVLLNWMGKFFHNVKVFQIIMIYTLYLTMLFVSYINKAKEK